MRSCNVARDRQIVLRRNRPRLKIEAPVHARWTKHSTSPSRQPTVFAVQGGHVQSGGERASVLICSLVMGNPWAVEGLLDATVSGLDDLGGNGADEGVECFCTDGVHDAFADFLRVKTSRREALSQNCFLI